jgi:myo-inositol-1(or 4)-monophosphatase
MTKHIEVLTQALAEAGGVLMKHYGALESIEKKGDINLVTVADKESEAVVKRVISGAFPSHQILGEESGEDFAGKGDEYRWVIDPLDGTTNYAHSCPQFCVSIALERRGEVLVAGVLNPYHKECFLAERGAGATLNGACIRVSDTSTLGDSLLLTGFPYDRRERVDHYLAFWHRMILRAQGILRMGAAALDMCWVACGRAEGYWEQNLYPWDTAAGWLILDEAGGRTTDFEGGAFSPYGKFTLATNGHIHDELVRETAAILHRGA